MKRKVFKILKYSGLPYLIREVYQKDKVSILMFHDIDTNTADKTFAYLTKKYNIITLDDYIDAYHNKNFKRLPSKSLIITFDDGHIANYRLLPLLEKYNVPITIFLCSEIVNTNRHYWFKAVPSCLNVQELKRKKTKERLSILQKYDFYKDKEYKSPQALKKEHIEKMKKIVNFQSHTMFHPILPMCDDDESRNEIFLSKSSLETKFSLKINSFAYPNGDYNDRDVEYVKEAGYKCAVTTKGGFNTIDTDIYKLKRFSVNDPTDMNELIVKSSGLWSIIKNII